MELYYKYTKKPKTVRELLHDFYNVKSENVYETMRASSTYSNKKCTHLQCHSGKYRSLTDLHKLCKTYFHNVSLKKVLFELLLIQHKKNIYFTVSHCNDINKLVVAKRIYHSFKQRDNYIRFTSHLSTNKHSGRYLSEKMFGKVISNYELIKKLNKYKKKYP